VSDHNPSPVSKSKKFTSLWRWLRILLLILVVLIILPIAVFLWWSLSPLLQNVSRGPYLQTVTTDSVWIVWETRQPTKSSVEYGPTRALGQRREEERTVTHHELQLTGLQPYSQYFYRVEGGKVASFRTAASSGQDGFRFAVFGDTRENIFVHQAIVKRILESNPDFVLHTGDMVEVGSCTECWDDFFRIEAPLLRNTPFYPTMGNHEEPLSPLRDTQYYDIFHLTGNELWYSFDYGDARFISLKADGYPLDLYYPQQEQLDWLETQLAENDRFWTFVFFHWGVYTSRGEDFLETGLRNLLVPLFEQYGVQAVFMGHNHGYERVLVNGITYITAAGGGAGLYDLSIIEPGSQAEARNYHFVLMEMEEDRLFGQAIDRRGKVFDQFEIFAR